MNLHRIEGRPEWAGIAYKDMNAWQKVAHRSAGILTIGNYFSLLGLLSVPFGLLLVTEGRVLWGTAILLLGRGCDLLDGLLADKTGTKSPLGEKIDAVFDKVSTALLVAVLAIGSLVPLWVVLLVVLPQVMTAVIAARVWLKGSVLHPSLFGKLSVAAGWLALLAFVLITSGSFDIRLLDTAAYLLVAVSAGLSAAALLGYYREQGGLLRGK